MNIVDECSWNTGFQQWLKKKKVIAGRPRPKLSELTELNLNFFWARKKISGNSCQQKVCWNECFHLKIVKIRWLVGTEHQLSPLDFGGPPVLPNYFAKSWLRYWYEATAWVFWKNDTMILLKWVVKKLLQQYMACVKEANQQKLQQNAVFPCRTSYLPNTETFYRRMLSTICACTIIWELIETILLLFSIDCCYFSCCAVL